MNDRLHVGTLVWGLVLAGWGTLVLGIDLDWWTIDLIELRYAGPILMIIFGVVIVVGALTPRDDSDD